MENLFMKLITQSKKEEKINQRQNKIDLNKDNKSNFVI